LEGRYITLVEHGVDDFVYCGGVLDVNALVLAVGGALSLEGPDKADWLVLVLGNGCILPLHHGLDGGVAGFLEAGEHVSIGVGVEDRDGTTLLAR
jgi:hypothetical protein